MDLNSMLNPKKPGEDERDRTRRSASVTSQHSKPSLPALTTSSSAGTAHYHSQSRTSDPYAAYGHPQSTTTPTPPPSFAPHGHSRSSQGHYGAVATPGSPPGHMHQPPLHSPQVLQSPYSHPAHTPGGGSYGQAPQYFSRQPSASSQTPNSAYDYPPQPQPQPQSQHRSPMSPQHHSRPPPPSMQSHHTYPQTPLGPPPSRNSLPPVLESPQSHKRRSSGNSQASHGAAPPQPPPQYSVPPPTLHHPGAGQYDSAEPRLNRPPVARYDSNSTNGLSVERERSISVSPRTVVTKIPEAMQESISRDSMPPRHQVAPERRSVEASPPNSSVASSHPQSFSGPTPAATKASPATITPQLHSEISPPQSIPKPVPQPSPPRTVKLEQESTVAEMATSQGLKRGRDARHPSHESLPPAKRTKKVKPPPIWAQPARNKRRDRPSTQPRMTNGHAMPAPSPAAARPPLATARPSGDSSKTSDWEPSFTNVTPFEDLSREVCDFLIAYIVRDVSLSTGDAGNIPSSAGQLEIEARLGKIIDKTTNERLNLPTRTECVLNQNMDVAFVSMMGKDQHKTFNEFLNHQTQASRQPATPSAKPRKPIDYKHTIEVDSFYELPSSEVSQLPHAIQVRIRQSGRSASVRVTRDAKTNEILAKIIKVPIDKIHVFNPKYAFDWRISVNAEMNWDGDVSALTPATEGKNRDRQPDRRKDRVSYKHQAYAIDLTQVTSGDGGLTHELEVEVSTKEVRELGQRALGGDNDSGFAELVKGFTDNVRVLARHVG